MFVKTLEDGSLALTTAGYALSIAALAVLLILAGIAAHRLTKKQKTTLSTRQISFCGLSIALATVLSMIKVYEFPFGGSITALSMLFICLPGWFYGLVPGILAAAAYGVLQFVLGPYILFPVQVVVDYLLAFAALGLSGLFVNAKRNSLTKGYLAGILGRYFFAVLSGWLFFGTYAWEGWPALPYSLAYNGAYIFAEGIATILVLQIPAVKKGLQAVKRMAVGS